ncbi:hypothetical protein LCGC14_1621760 [marine sediment metagenome]|uniref:Uncharacterized protein n=1 Tax=marine sediment metagenome TaxID=412755 RepID=A0A0F9L5A1_9ZZZZ
MSKEYEITITVDTNDADYMTKVSKISHEDLEKIKPLIAAIKNFKPYLTQAKGKSEWKHENNYPYRECCREDLGEETPEEIYIDFDEETHELFLEFIELSEYGFHTVKSVEVCPWRKKEKLL